MQTFHHFKKWFSNLKVSQKLTLIGVFFVIPDSVMLYLFITGINANIQFARLEKMGNEYQRPLEELLELIPQHRHLTAELIAGAPGVRAELADKQSQIDSAFAELERVDSRIGADLQFTDDGLAKRKREHYRPRIVRAEWEELKHSLVLLDLFGATQRHAHLVADVRTMITHAGDMSNLILDPDLDSYYVMDTTLLALPQNQDRMAATIAYVESVFDESELSSQDRQQLAVFTTLLKEADLNRIVSSMQVALNEDPNFYGISPSLQRRVPAALKSYSDATAHFIDLTRELVTAPKAAFSKDDYLAAGQKACDASFNLWRIADGEVDALLQTRIDDYMRRRAQSLIVTACALLAATCFVTFITRSISQPLHRQAAELQLANDALEAEVAERKRAEDELRQNDAQLAAAQKIAALGSWEWTIQNGVMFWSEENYRIHGVEPQHFLPTFQSALSLVTFGDRLRSHEILKQAVLDGLPFSFEQRISREDGEERILQQRGEAVLDASGKVLKLVGTAQDVTERKRADAELENAHRELLAASRQAGMAEVATGVLHNVGNVLNSVNVSAMLIAERLTKSRVSHLANVAAMLKEHTSSLGDFLTTDPKGKMLPRFMETLAERLSAEQAELLREAEGLTRNIGHIKDIVSVQQGYAKGVSGMMEMHSPVSLVNDALHMNSTALERHGIEVLREFEESAPVLVDKHKMLQILINLIRNAKHAMDDPSLGVKKLAVRIHPTSAGRVRIELEDSGVGIPSEHLARIFAFGFTTRSEGHGFGLHSAALAASEMGGSLTAQSPGPGCGATFTLELPLEKSARVRPYPLAAAA